MRYSLILRNRRKWRHNFLTLGDNSLEIRRYRGKVLGTNHDMTAEQELAALKKEVVQLNNRPRKTLMFETPKQVLHKSVALTG